MRTESFPRVLIAVCIVSAMFAGVLAAGTFTDNFDDNGLDEMWVAKVAGKASFEIKGGEIILTSPSVADGIDICYRTPLKGDVSCEVKFDTTVIEGGFAHLGFFTGILAPMNNLEMHPTWVEVLYCSKDKAGGVVNNGRPAANWNRVVGAPNEVPVEPGEHVWTIEVKNQHVKFFIDEQLKGEADNPVTERYFLISADPYTSHYTGKFAVDSVKLTGDSIVTATAVESSS